MNVLDNSKSEKGFIKVSFKRLCRSLLLTIKEVFFEDIKLVFMERKFIMELTKDDINNYIHQSYESKVVYLTNEYFGEESGH